MIPILLAAVIVGLVVVAGFLLYVRNTHKTKIEAAAAIATKAEAAAAYAAAEVAAVRAKMEAMKTPATAPTSGGTSTAAAAGK